MSVADAVEKMRVAWDIMPGGMLLFTYERQMRIIDFNAEMPRLLEMSAEEFWECLQGGDVLDWVIQKEDRYNFHKAVSAVVKKNQIWSHPVAFLNKNGERRLLQVNMKRISEEGQSLPIYGIFCLKLADELAYYEEIINDSSNGVMVISQKEDQILFINERLKSMVDLEGKELTGRKYAECMGHLEERGNGSYHAQLNREEYTSTLIENAKDRQYYVKRGKLIDWNGTLARIEYFTDETERVQRNQRAEIRYQQEQEKFKALENELLVVVSYSITKDCVLSYKKDTQIEQLMWVGMSNEQMIQQLKGEVPDEEDRKKIDRYMRREVLLSYIQQGITEQRVEYQRYDKDNRLIWVQVILSIVENPYNNEHILYVYVRDITTQRESEQVIQQILFRDYDDIAVITLESREVKYLGVDVEYSILPKLIRPDADLEERRRAYQPYSRDTDLDMILQQTELDYVVRQLETFHSYGVNCTMQMQEREQRKRINFSYLDDSRQKICLVVQDVTEAYQEEQKRNIQLAEALKLAEEANAAKGEFLSRMSHDIRTPLNGILGMTSLALDETKETGIQDYLEKISASGKYLLGLINDILDISKIESGKVELHLAPCELHEFVTNIQSIIQPLCEVKGIHLDLCVTDMECRIIVDQMRLSQILLNLLNNAVKFTPEGGRICLQIEAKEKDPRQMQLRFQIEDSGIGMDPSFMEHMYEPFSQGRPSNTGEHGSGLGLAIVKNLVEIMGGTIRVKSEVQKGTSFQIELGFERANNIIVRTDALQGEPEEAIQGLHILVVEDNPINAEITRKLLVRQGAIVMQVENGRQAVDVFEASKENAYDVILMDICMPVLDGLEATKEIRRLKRKDAQKIPIIAMTANAYNTDIEASIEAGMNAHISKPIEREKMYQTICRVLHTKRIIPQIREEKVKVDQRIRI